MVLAMQRHLAKPAETLLRRFCKPKVGGSNPSPGTIDAQYLLEWCATRACSSPTARGHSQSAAPCRGELLSE
jgi:hypothetical protein